MAYAEQSWIKKRKSMNISQEATVCYCVGRARTMSSKDEHHFMERTLESKR